MPDLSWTQMFCEALRSLYEKLVVARAKIHIESRKSTPGLSRRQNEERAVSQKVA